MSGIGEPGPAAAEPLVSVVLPVHDGTSTLLAAVRSVLRQSHGRLEVVVVDDGSTDDPSALLARIDDPRLRVIRQPRAGVGAARNRGIGETSGPYVAFIDADDLWLPDKIAEQLAALRRRPGAAVAYSWTDFVDGDGYRIGGEERVRVEGQVREALLRRFFLASSSNALVLRSALAEVGGWSEELRGALDWDLFLRLAERYPFACAPSVGVYYRLAPGSMSADVENQEEVCRAVIRRAVERQPVSHPGVLSEALANLHLYLAFRALGDEPRAGDLRHATRHLARCVRSDPSLLLRRPAKVGKLSVRLALRAALPAGPGRRVARWWRKRRSPAVLSGMEA